MKVVIEVDLDSSMYEEDNNSLLEARLAGFGKAIWSYANGQETSSLQTILENVALNMMLLRERALREKKGDK